MIAHTNMFRPTPESNFQRPPALGNVYYVDNGHTHTSDSNEGTDANHPLTKVQAAIDKCTASQGDYVFVLDCYDADTTTISINEATCHVIGMSLPTAWQWTTLTGAGTHDVINIAQTYIELAGFSLLSAGFDGIHLTNPSGFSWIHHCNLGAAGETLANGIEFDSTYGTNILIEDCTFGNKITSVTAYGIYGGVHQSTIRNNIFKECATVAIYITGDVESCNIYNNIISITDDVNGEAITLDTQTTNHIIVNNFAVNGMLSGGYTYTPYRDLAGNTGNHWGMNYQGNRVVEPVGV